MSNGSEFSHSELRRLVDEFGELAGQWRRQRASYVGQLQQAIAHFGVGPQSETVERYERARRQAWLLLPPDARAGCTSFREFVEGQTGEPLSGSLPTSAESCADAILRYLCESATDQSDVKPAKQEPVGTWLSSSDLARRHGLVEKRDALDKRLNRWRFENGNGWLEIPDSDRRPREPKFLYDPTAVAEIIDAMKGKK
jgi:hypothetical protein